MENLVRSSSNRTKEKVISSQFKEVFEDRNISTAGGTAKLATSGTPLQTTLGSVDPKQPAKKFSSGGLKIMKDVENFLRVKCGRGSVVKLKEDMVDRNKYLKMILSVR